MGTEIRSSQHKIVIDNELYVVTNKELDKINTFQESLLNTAISDENYNKLEYELIEYLENLVNKKKSRGTIEFNFNTES